MERTFQMPYGRRTIPLTVRAREIETLEAAAPTPIADLAAVFRDAVERPIDSPPLRELIAPDDRVTLVVSDLTRSWMHQERFCPLLTAYLHDELGVPYENIVILVAVGTHRAMTEPELRRLVTDAVFDRVRVVNHDCEGPLEWVGTTSRGTDVRVNPLVVGRKVILLGGTVHHFFAGYGGGRKSIVPGVSGRETIMQNHAHALDPLLPRSNPLCGLGVTAGNPVHEDMLEAAALVNPVFGLNIVVDAHGELLALPGGHWKTAWEESCRLVDRFNGVPFTEKADAVVVSSGGFPKDLNLYQGCKGLINGYQALREGGELVFLSECPEGGGPAEFFDWSRYLPDRLDAALRADFTVAGYIFYVCVEIARNAHVRMVSELPAEVLGPMGIAEGVQPERFPSVLDFGDKRVIVMPNGGGTVPMLQKEPDA